MCIFFYRFIPFLASGGWTESELPFVKKMSALLDYYKHLAHQDKMEKARQKITKRRTNMYLMVIFPLNPNKPRFLGAVQI